MPRKYFVFTNLSDQASATIRIAHDAGWTATAAPGTDPAGRHGQVFTAPDSMPDGAGAQLNLDAEGKIPLQMRGVATYSPLDPTRFYLACDDFTLIDVPAPPEPPEPPEPPPVTGNTPLEIINGVYATGAHDLSTKSGCGGFTEECCRQLARRFGPQWGHIAKSPGQNQWNNHAVDALYALYGNDVGVWDIIQDSVSSNAKPACNDAGPGEPEEWRPPSPLPVQPMSASARRITVTIAVDDLIRLAGLLKATA